MALIREGFPDVHLEVMSYRRVLPLVDGRFYADSVRCIEYGPMAACFNPKAKMADDMAEYFLSFGQIISYLYDPDLLFQSSLKRIGVKNLLPISPKPGDHEHAARQFAAPLSSLALFLEDPSARVFLSPLDRQVAAGHTQGLTRSPIAIHPGSGSPRKNWPPQKWAEVIEHLLASGPVFLVGGEADVEPLTHLRFHFGKRLSIFESLPLNELGAILSTCRMFLGHDSGISHLAAAVGVPCKLLFGPTDPDVWAPAGSHVEVFRAVGEDLSQVDVRTFLDFLGGEDGT
jgi:heptosyltransferase-2